MDSIVLVRYAIGLLLGLLATFVPAQGEIFLIESEGEIFVCGLTGSWVVGRYAPQNNTFTPSVTLIAQKKKKLKRLSGVAKTKLRRAIVSETKYMKAGESLCALGPGGVATPLPDDGGAITPTPTPTPTPIPGACFELNGDTKVGCFGIPQPWVGNKVDGETYYSGNCLGCHEAKSYKTYQQLDSAFNTISQMQGFRPQLMQDFVDVVAYLNRFSL